MNEVMCALQALFDIMPLPRQAPTILAQLLGEVI